MSNGPEQSDELEREPPPEPPGPPDQRGIDPGTWGMIFLCLLVTLALLAWAAYAGLPSPG